MHCNKLQFSECVNMSLSVRGLIKQRKTLQPSPPHSLSLFLALFHCFSFYLLIFFFLFLLLALYFFSCSLPVSFSFSPLLPSLSLLDNGNLFTSYKLIFIPIYMELSNIIFQAQTVVFSFLLIFQ